MPGVIMRRRAVGIDVVLRQTFTDETVVLSNRNSADIVRINFASSVTGVAGLTHPSPA
jgi:hypothetical protein